MSQTGTARTFPRNGQAPSCFKPDRRSPFRDLPSGDRAQFIKSDPAHSYAINGWGKDWISSSILVLAHLGIFGNYRNVGAKLRVGFDCFKTWCKEHKKQHPSRNSASRPSKCNRPLAQLNYYYVACKSDRWLSEPS